MFDQVILFIDNYFIWIALAIAAYKILHIVLYKGLHPKYILSTYFVIFSGVHITAVKDYSQRTRFRKVHNILTIAFYVFFSLWLIVRITIGGALNF